MVDDSFWTAALFPLVHPGVSQGLIIIIRGWKGGCLCPLQHKFNFMTHTTLRPSFTSRFSPHAAKHFGSLTIHSLPQIRPSASIWAAADPTLLPHVYADIQFTHTYPIYQLTLTCSCWSKPIFLPVHPLQSWDKIRLYIVNVTSLVWASALLKSRNINVRYPRM